MTLRLLCYIILSNLCLVRTVIGQSTDGIDDLKQRFTENVTHVHNEKVFLATDRSLYLTGETIWMSAYCVDAAFHTPSDVSKVLNIELLDHSNQPIKQMRIEMNKGLGEASLFISPNIRTGVYQLRAYTRWMRNADSNYFFNEPITIINPSVDMDKEPTIDPSKPLVQFFPEGGQMIFGEKGRIAVKTTNSLGEPLMAEVKIFDNQNQEVAQCTTSSLGLGAFWLKPEAGRSYTARIENQDKSLAVDLPDAQSSGVSLTVSQDLLGSFKIDIGTQTIESGKHLYLIIHTRGVIQQLMALPVTGGQQTVDLEANKLAPGITHISVLDVDFRPLAERLIFNYPAEHQWVDVASDKGSYLRREKVVLNIDQLIGDLEADNCHLSVSVVPAADKVPSDISYNLLLASDVPGISQGRAFFDQKNENRKEDLDMLLMSHGWRRFNWQELGKNWNKEVVFKPESYGPILTGKINKKFERKPRLVMSFEGVHSFLNATLLSDDDHFSFEVPKRIGNSSVYFYCESDTLGADDLALDSPFDLRSFSGTDLYIDPEKYDLKYLEQLNRNTQLGLIYTDITRVNGIYQEVSDKNSNFYGKSDIGYLLDDYTRFQSIRDSFIEYIPSSSGVIYKRKGKLDFYTPSDGGFSFPAFLLVDGVPVRDPEIVLDLNPEKVREINFVHGTYYLGNAQLTGIVDFSTFDGDFGEKQLPSDLIKKAYAGISGGREFYSPHYDLNLDLTRVPDYRNTLYWNPNVDLKPGHNKTLTFYTSDVTGSYKIIINGITDGGQTIHQTHTFSVVDELP